MPLTPEEFKQKVKEDQEKWLKEGKEKQREKEKLEDDYYQALGDELEKYPILPKGIRRRTSSAKDH